MERRGRITYLHCPPVILEKQVIPTLRTVLCVMRRVKPFRLIDFHVSLRSMVLSCRRNSGNVTMGEARLVYDYKLILIVDNIFGRLTACSERSSRFAHLRSQPFLGH